MNMQELNLKLLKFQFNAKQRGRIYRKLATFIRNGIPLSKALEIMQSHESDDGLKPKAPTAVILGKWLSKIQNGISIGHAVEGWIPDGDRIVIEAGDTAGSLAVAIENAMFIHEASKKIKSAIIGGLAYPVLLIGLALGFMILFGVQIIPSFEAIVPREKWDGLAADMALVADFVDYWLLPIGIAVFIAGCLTVWSMPRWIGPTRVKFDRYPPWSLYRLNSGAGFMLSVSALVKAGVKIPDILRILQRNSSPWYDERISGALRFVNNGVNMGEALYRTRLEFPDKETVKDLRSYADLDGFDETLEKLGKQSIEDSIEKIRNQTGIMRNVAFVVLGIVFAVIASGIFALETMVQNSV